MDFHPYLHFWNEFGNLKKSFKKYDLEGSEELLGSWWPAEFMSSGTFRFLPNFLFIYFTYIHTSEKSTLYYIIGKWEITEGDVSVEIYGYIIEYGSKKTRQYKYLKCKPYKTRLINIDHLVNMGYSKRKFAYLPLPEEISGIISNEDIRENNEASYRFRVLYSVALNTSNFPNDKVFWELGIVPDLAQKDYSAMDLIDDGALLIELLSEANLF